MKNLQKMWRDSASLMVLVKKGLNRNSTHFNYDLLTFKRSANTSFMKNSVVFPGGATEKLDEAREWIDLYSKLGISHDKLKQLSSEIVGARSFIFQKGESDSIEREISLRITAIRETFEELGILICKTQEEFQNDSIFTKVYDKLDIGKWQNIVHNDSSQFIKMCKNFNIAPDLWNNFEWSTWLTPASFGPRRFEVAFFIVALEKLPKVNPEPHEVAAFILNDPQELLLAHRNEEIWLPPPQIYELMRLKQFSTVEKVMEFAKQRNKYGSTLFYPIVYTTKNSFMQLLPGDDMYPKNPDYNNADVDQYKDKTTEELRANVKNLHRTENNSFHGYKLYMNIEALDGHVNFSQDPLLNKL